jgi:predicted dehydrogenase
LSAESTKPVRIGMVGLGFMGLVHLKALEFIPGAQLAAVCSRDHRKLGGDLSAIQGNLGPAGEHFDFGNIAKFTEIDALVADPDIDAVDICLPTSLHAPAAIAALRAGKHVLVEKPMALDPESCKSMLATARSADRILMVAQVLRFFPMYQALSELVESGRLGVPRFAVFGRRCAAPAWSGWLSDARQSGGGAFDLLIHDVDMCLRLFGKPERVSANGYENLASGIDVMEAELSYPAGWSAFISGGWHHPQAYPFTMEYTVVMDHGTVDYSSEGRPPALYGADGCKKLLPVPSTDGYAAEIEYFIGCCQSRRRPEACLPEESAAAVATMRLLLESRNRKGERLSCEI